MQLVINTYGSYLQKNGDCFKVKKDEQVFEVSAKKVDGIMITTVAYITTDAIKLAMDHNIDIIFLDEFGDPFGRVWHSTKLGSTTLIRRRQLEIADTTEGVNLALDWVRKKLDNQIGLLTRLRESRSNKSAEITAYIDKLRNCRNSFDSLIPKDASHIGIEDVRGSIMGIEGSGGRIILRQSALSCPTDINLRDAVVTRLKMNLTPCSITAMAFCTPKVEKACIIAGLDPYVGIIHTDHYNKKSLVFDLIENFRIWADETIIKIFAGREVKQEHFDKLENGFTLNKEGKALLISAFSSFLDESIRYGGRNIKRGDIIQFECHKIANGMIK